jgi:O-antigen/teichoic acid export membrane protein
MSYLSIAQAMKIMTRFYAFSMIAKNLSIDQYGQFIIIISFCEFFQIFTLPGLSKPLVRAAIKDIEKIDDILSDKSGLRNLFAIIAIVLANISVSFMGYDNSAITLIRFYSVILLIDSLRTYIRIIFNCFEVFKWISISEIVQAATYLILVAISIKYQLGAKGIVFSSALSIIISFIIDYINSRKYSKFNLFGGFEIDKVFLISASIFTLTNIMWIIITKLDILMLSVLTTTENVALYGVANRMIFFCMMGISIVSKVLFPTMLRMLKDGQLKIKHHLFKILGLYTLIYVCCLIVFLFSELIVTTIADKKYMISSEIFNILLLFLIIQAMSVPVKLILFALDKEKIVLLILLPLPIIKVIANMVLFKTYGLHGIAYATVIVYAVYLLSLIIINRKLLKDILLIKP